MKILLYFGLILPIIFSILSTEQESIQLAGLIIGGNFFGLEGSTGGAPAHGDSIKLETDDYILLETGDVLLKE